MPRVGPPGPLCALSLHWPAIHGDVALGERVLLPAGEPDRRDGEDEDGEPLNRGKSHGSAAANTDPE